MKLKKLLISLSLLFLVLSLSLVGVVQAATTGDVTATVTAQQISISVTDGSVAYGTLGLDSSKSTLSGGVNDQQTATNNGNVAEDFTINGANATPTWILDSANSTSNHYIHKFCVATCGTEASPTNFTALTTSPAALGAGNVAASGTQTFDLRITTPQTTTDYTQQTVTVTVTAAAH